MCAVSSIAYEQGTGVAPTITEDVAMQAAFGAGLQSFGFGSGRDYVRAGSFWGSGWNNRFAQAAKGGVAQGFGFSPIPSSGPGQLKYSFLGLPNIREGLRKDLVSFSQSSGQGIPDGFFGKAKMVFSAKKSGFGFSGVKGAFQKAGGGVGGTLGKAFFPALGLGTTALSVYGGYKEGGLWGAAKEGTKSLAGWAAFEVGSAAFASLTGISATSILLPAAVIGGGIYGAKKAIDSGRDHYRGMRDWELATPSQDPYGLGFTMRQRSVQAIQRSAINGRIALGNEAALLHQRLI